MNLNNYTIKSQEALQEAQQLGASLEQQAIEPAHILMGILKADENVAPFLLKKVNVNTANLEQALNAVLKTYPKVSGGGSQASQMLKDSWLN
jgi:ATP-dependent Clp protease ATP-binding subunit ClpB